MVVEVEVEVCPHLSLSPNLSHLSLSLSPFYTTLRVKGGEWVCIVSRGAGQGGGRFLYNPTSAREKWVCIVGWGGGRGVGALSIQSYECKGKMGVHCRWGGGGEKLGGRGAEVKKERF